VQIDYFTIVAQIINFLILIVLLRHFLYRPVIQAMNKREQKIASRLKEAEQNEKEAKQGAESYRRAQAELWDKRQEMLSRAFEEVKAQRLDLMKKAEMEVEESKARWYEGLERQKEAFLADLRKEAGEEIYIVASRVLKDLANEELERQIITAFIQRLQNMDEAEKEAIKEFYKAPGKQITLRSSFEIPEEMQQRIQETVRDLTTAEVKLNFETAPELIAGVEMSAHNLKIAWSIDSYLDALQADLSTVLEQRMAGKEIAEEKAGRR
jgi:F-type H+-transporting ATPase subunit b